MKICKKCKIEKNISEFNKNRCGKEGTHCYCKECDREKSRLYYEKNREKERERVRVYREANLEKELERGRVYRQNNPEKVRQHKRKRRAKKREVEERYTPEMEAFTYTFFGGKCYNCGSTENITHDHHLPLSKGHALAPGNAVILCLACNCSKGTKLPKNFYTREQLTEINTLLIHQAQLWSMGARIEKEA